MFRGLATLALCGRNLLALAILSENLLWRLVGCAGVLLWRSILKLSAVKKGESVTADIRFGLRFWLLLLLCGAPTSLSRAQGEEYLSDGRASRQQRAASIGFEIGRAVQGALRGA